MKIIHGPEDIVGLKYGDPIQYICKRCGKTVHRKYFKQYHDRIERMFCMVCASKYKKKLLYGDENYNNHEKCKQTVRAIYGVDNVFQNTKINEKRKKSMIDKYGVEFTQQCPELIEKCKESLRKHYGVEYTFDSEEIREKALQKKRDLYGDEHYNNHEKCKETKKSRYDDEYYNNREKCKETKLALYDDPYYTNREKAIQTMIDRYDVPYSGMSKELFEKTKQTKKRIYGDENYSNREKAIQSMIDRHGVPYSGMSEKLFEKTKQTKKLLYGDENYTNREKAKETNLRKYGVEYPSTLPEFREKAKQTLMNKYGVDSVFKHPDVIKRVQLSKGRHRYTYNDTYFDSSWELALWIYANDHGEDIERVEEPFEYYDGDKKHYYFPDFIYKGQLVEIKGEQFINNGTMVNPYDPSQDELFAAKQRCAINNGVEFMLKEDVQFAIDYARKKFGNDKQWYNRFLTNSNSVQPLQLTPLLSMMPMYIYPTIPMMLPWWMFMTPCDFNPYSNNVFEREGMEFIDCECEYE